MRQIKYMILVFALGVNFIPLGASLESEFAERMIQKAANAGTEAADDAAIGAIQRAGLAETEEGARALLAERKALKAPQIKGKVAPLKVTISEPVAAEQEALQAPVQSKPKAPAIPKTKPKLKPPVNPKAAETVLAEGEAGIKAEPTPEPAAKPTSKRPVPATREKTLEAMKARQRALMDLDQVKQQLANGEINQKQFIRTLEDQEAAGRISKEKFLSEQAHVSAVSEAKRADMIKGNLPKIENELAELRSKLANLDMETVKEEAQATLDRLQEAPVVSPTRARVEKEALAKLANPEIVLDEAFASINKAQLEVLNNSATESGARMNARRWEIEGNTQKALDSLKSEQLSPEEYAARKKIIVADGKLALQKDVVLQAQIEIDRLSAQVPQMDEYVTLMKEQKKATLKGEIDPALKKTLGKKFDQNIELQDNNLTLKKQSLVKARKALADAQKKLTSAAEAAAQAAQAMPVPEVAIQEQVVPEGALVQEVVPEEAPAEEAPVRMVEPTFVQEESKEVLAEAGAPEREATPEEQKSAQAIETQNQKASPTLRQRWQRLTPDQKKAAGVIGAAGVGAATIIGVAIDKSENN